MAYHDEYKTNGQSEQRKINTLNAEQKAARTLVKALKAKDLPRLTNLIAQTDRLDALLTQPAQQGATPKQWALWIQHAPALNILGLAATGKLNVFEGSQVKTRNAEATLKQFNFAPIEQPRFESPRAISSVLRYLRWLFHWNFFQDSCLWHAAQHKDFLNQPCLSHFLVQHIDDVLGYGVIAQRSVDVGEFVGEYLGNINLRHLFSAERDTTYVIDYPIPMPPGYRWSIDARCYGNFTRFINHSAEPNCHVAVAYDGFIFRLIILAKKKIRPGQELRLNYGKDYWRHRSEHIKKTSSVGAPDAGENSSVRSPHHTLCVSML